MARSALAPINRWCTRIRRLWLSARTTVTAAGRTCKDCHNSERMLELRDTGQVVMTRWDAETGKLVHTTGVVSFVPDKFEFQFVTLDGKVWVPLTTKTGRFQYEFCSPLSAKQLKALGAKGT